VTPHVLVDPDDEHVVEAVLVIDQHPLALGQHSVVGGVPRDPESLGHTRHGEVLDHDPLQCPPKPPPRQPGPRLGRRAGVLAPHMRATATPVATHDHLKDGGSPAQRLVSQPADDGVADRALAAASTTPLIGLDHTARHTMVARLSVEGWNGQDQTVDLSGDGPSDGRLLATSSAALLRVPWPPDRE